MLYRAASFAAFTLVASFPAAAAELPAIKASKDNAVPACVTPGRLMAFVKARNTKLQSQFDGLATEYMRHGEALGIRWDYAFFQMLVETGNLGFTGDVKPRQNNFAGLGATGGGEPGESFKDISTGAQAHLEHVLMYSGAKLDNPTAERTRKVQEWGILTSWQKSIKGPMTFAHLTRKWSPKDRRYSDDIASVAEAFANGACKGDDPRPELVQEARSAGGVVKVAAVAPTAKSVEDNERISGTELARQAVSEARASGEGSRSGLGAAGLAAAAKPQPAITILNAPKEAGETEKSDKADIGASAIEPLAQTNKPARDTKPAVDKDPAAKSKGKDTKSAAVPANGKPPATAAVTPQPGGPTGCRVWQASYGGAKAVIIKASSGPETNYTVLDVNEGAEAREAEAFIAAYARGGQTVGEYGSSTQALDKAFELCPEG